MKTSPRSVGGGAAAAALLALQALASAQGDAGDLTALSLEELLSIKVTSVSRKEGTVHDSPAAVFVITAEDIRRSGHNSIPELLRMVPGLHVARITSNTWAVAARGFNSRFTDKLLVMIDGRTVYTNLFSGVFWDVQDVLLEDVERIEVIRGPGGAMWGANAVNGVINIITKSAADTQGPLGSLLAGDEDRVIAGLRHGGTLGEDAHWRVYAKGFDRDGSESPGGGEHTDEWSGVRGGFRVDWQASERDLVTVQADAYDSRVRDGFVLPSMNPPFFTVIDSTFDATGANLLGRWTRTSSDDAQFSLQAYVDLTNRSGDAFDDERDTFDLDYQHRLRMTARHDLQWGAGFRWINSHIEGFPGSIDFDPDDRDDQLLSFFVQDELTLVPDETALFLGTKLEYNEFTGLEVQPSVRMLWTPGERSSYWAAVSRAVRTPAVLNEDVMFTTGVIPGMPPTVTVLTGDSDFQSEELIAYEAGARFSLSDDLALDVAAFYNDYDRLATVEPGVPFDAGGFNILPLTFDNKASGSSVGLEVAADLQLTERWKLLATGTLFTLDVDRDSDSQDGSVEDSDDAPSWLASLQSRSDLTDEIELDLGLYAVDDLDDLDVDGYVRLDGRLGWRVHPDVELALGVQNACDPDHQEYASGFVSSHGLIERAYYVTLRWLP